MQAMGTQQIKVGIILAPGEVILQHTSVFCQKKTKTVIRILVLTQQLIEWGRRPRYIPTAIVVAPLLNLLGKPLIIDPSFLLLPHRAYRCGSGWRSSTGIQRTRTLIQTERVSCPRRL